MNFALSDIHPDACATLRHSIFAHQSLHDILHANGIFLLLRRDKALNTGASFLCSIGIYGLSVGKIPVVSISLSSISHAFDSSGLNVPPVAETNVPAVAETNVPSVAFSNVPPEADEQVPVVRQTTEGLL